MKRVVRYRGLRRVLLVAPLLLTNACLAGAFAVQAQADCPNAAFRTGFSANLADCRAYEQVSPASKNGAGVVSDSQRTRAAADGGALQFLSLGAFGDAVGTGISTEYVSERTAAPGTSGWATHAITPLQSGSIYDGITSGLEPRYVGEFTSDLSKGVFFAQSPLTADPYTAGVPNLYLRTDLLSAQAGSYKLLSACPACSSPFPAPSNADVANAVKPVLAWMSPDASRVVFESSLRLTADASPLGRVEAYEWDGRSVVLVGRVPRVGASFCDDMHGPACVGALSSVAGQGASNFTRTPHVVADGSDGHSRVFFTVPTTSRSQVGQLYMRVDGTSTVQLNASERSTPDTSAPAVFLDASTNGERVFFATQQALTNDTPANSSSHIYMYDASSPASAPNHLTYINADHEPADGTAADGQGLVGLSDDGHYAYFIADGQIVSGGPLNPGPAVYLWHDGTVRYVTSLSASDLEGMTSSGQNFIEYPYQPRVSPDGRWLLYRAVTGSASQFYLFDAESGGGDPPVCVSCGPSGASRADATDAVRTDNGGTQTSWHETRALAGDASRVFFSTAQALVPEDVNGRVDVYEYDVAAGRVSLVSSGTSPDDSWFLDASLSGDDVFFSTMQQLVGWDSDQEYDIYDARVSGGFPDPPASTPSCVGSVCQGPLASPPLVVSGASAVVSGAGNTAARRKPKTSRCRRGYVRKRLRGRLRCVKRPKRAIKKQVGKKRALKAGRARGAHRRVA